MEPKDRLNKNTSPGGSADARASEKEEMLQNYLYWLLKNELSKKPPSSDACGDIPADKAYALPPDKPSKNHKASFVFFAIVAALAVLIIIAYIPRYQRLNSPSVPQEVITNIQPAPADSESSAAPEPLPEAAQLPVAASEAMPEPSPVVDAAPRVKVIGNSDSLRYHLPGMKFYSAVKAYHRVEFDSEEEAIRAGYHKAPR